MALVMLAFWTLFRTRPTWADWVSVGFFVWGNLLGVLVISQFWTLANGIYDPRQAKRLFGFIGGGVMLGGMTGSGLTSFIIESVGANTLLLWSALTLIACLLLVSGILGKETRPRNWRQQQGMRREGCHAGARVPVAPAVEAGPDHRARDRVRLYRRGTDRPAAQHGFGRPGRRGPIGKFLAQVRFAVSAAALVIQVWVTPRIHRYLGIGFALLMLPTSVAATAIAIVLTGVPWAAAIARITDRSLRYSVDKTTREVLFLPLPSALRQEVKPLVDVTVDRVSRGAAAILILILIQPWGLHFTWQQLSYVSLALIVLWYVNAFRAKREYLTAFRQSLERRDVQPSRTQTRRRRSLHGRNADGGARKPSRTRVLYAIEILESLDKRNLVTPLLLYHASRPCGRGPSRRSRCQAGDRGAVASVNPADDRRRESRGPRGGHLGAREHPQEQVTDLLRPFLQDPEPRIATTAAVALAHSDRESDVAASEEVLSRLASDTHESKASGRKDVAAAIRQIADPRFRPMLIPLVYDSNPDVAAEAMQSVRALGRLGSLFVPTLVSLLRHRTLKSSARETLVGYGEDVLDALAYVLRDQDEDIWVRRHLPGDHRADSRAEVGGHPDRGPAGGRRLSAIQGRGGPREAAARAARISSSRASRSRRSR